MKRPRHTAAVESVKESFLVEVGGGAFALLARAVD